mmetsp:Transcript_106212/g.342655  ORF Transcript_106212/g.342655 Transcript_106212/m.342655 type:complete len:230 (-) Transcript_106212:20-709(-)
MGLQFLAEPGLLGVLDVGRDKLSGSDLAIGGDDCPASGGGLGLSPTDERPGLTIHGEADMRAEEDDHMALVRHMVREGPKASLADVGCPANAAKRKHHAKVLREQSRDVSLVAVDLVGADGLAIDGVTLLHAVLPQGRQHSPEYGRTRQCSGETLLDNLGDVHPLQTQEILRHNDRLRQASASCMQHESQGAQRRHNERQTPRGPRTAHMHSARSQRLHGRELQSKATP